jgi:DNA-binding NarL/FixJ family response regulator
MSIRVLLADDQALLRATFRLLIESERDMEVVGEAPDGHAAVRLARSERPDIVLMDIRMPQMDGIEATQHITDCDHERAVKIIILTTFETEDLVVSALRAGASGYLGKGVEPANLLAAIRTVAAGDSLLSPSATRTLITRMLAQPTFEPSIATALLDELTPREREILLLVARGHSTTEIAERLFITPLTAKTHINRTMVKLQAHDRAQLVIVAYESGLLKAGLQA